MKATIKQACVLAGALMLGACSTSAASVAAPAASPTATGTATGTGTAPPTTVAPGPVQLRVVDTRYGKAIARGDGKVVYAWDQETGADATCLDAECVGKWPPLTATSISATDGLDPSWFALVPRPDGTMQVAVQGRRLYTMTIDAPGEANCQDTDGWYLRNPDGSSNRTEVGGKDDDDHEGTDASS
jgi:predicted lipoprotein with Yx(FWY)xxD motif